MVQKNKFNLKNLKKINFKKIKKLPWVLWQPLSRIPNQPNSRISDLFVWINTKDIITSYEFMDLPSLFQNDNSEEQSFFYLVLFNKYGNLIDKIRIDINPKKRFTINFEKYLKNIDDKMGTFSIFHNENPKEIQKLNSFISDRGYVKYYLKNLDLYKYVHGNLDALSYDDININNLGARSFLKRKYFIQCNLEKNATYKFYLVNYSNNKQKFSLYSLINNKFISSIEINKRGCEYFHYKCIDNNDILYIKSKLVMSRPLIYVETNQDMDFFHG